MDNSTTTIQVYWMALKRTMTDANTAIDGIVGKGTAANQFTIDVSSNPSAAYIDFYNQIVADYNAAAPLLALPPVAAQPTPAFFHFMTEAGGRNRATMEEIADALASMGAVFTTNDAPTNIVPALPQPSAGDLASEATLLLSWWHDFGGILVECWRWTDPRTIGIYDNKKMNASLTNASATINEWSRILDQDASLLMSRYNDQLAALQKLHATLGSFTPPAPRPSTKLDFVNAINAYSSVLKMLPPILRTELDLINHLMAIGGLTVLPPDPYTPPWLGTYNPEPIVTTFVPAMPPYIYAGMIVLITILAAIVAWALLKLMADRGLLLPS